MRSLKVLRVSCNNKLSNRRTSPLVSISLIKAKSVLYIKAAAVVNVNYVCLTTYDQMIVAWFIEVL